MWFSTVLRSHETLKFLPLTRRGPSLRERLANIVLDLDIKGERDVRIASLERCTDAMRSIACRVRPLH